MSSWQGMVVSKTTAPFLLFIYVMHIGTWDYPLCRYGLFKEVRYGRKEDWRGCV